MPCRSFLAPLLSAVILAVSAFLGAGTASAHPGHAHGVTTDSVMPVQMSPVVEVAVAAEMIGTLLEIETATAMSFEVAVRGAPGRDPKGGGCVGMCCDNTHCGGCVKVAFGKASLPTPLLCAWLPASVEARKLSGHLAERPNEPPRTFI